MTLRIIALLIAVPLSMLAAGLAVAFAYAGWETLAAGAGVELEMRRLGESAMRQREIRFYARTSVVILAIGMVGPVGIHAILSSLFPGAYLAHVPSALIELCGLWKAYRESYSLFQKPAPVLAQFRARLPEGLFQTG